MKIMQHIQRAEAAAEVIHPYFEAFFPETFNLPLHKIKIGTDDAFRNFNPEQARVDPGPVHTAGNLLHHIAGVKIRPAQVH